MHVVPLDGVVSPQAFPGARRTARGGGFYPCRLLTVERPRATVLNPPPGRRFYNLANRVHLEHQNL